MLKGNYDKKLDVRLALASGSGDFYIITFLSKSTEDANFPKMQGMYKDIISSFKP
jgi:hypothetical protein